MCFPSRVYIFTIDSNSCIAHCLITITITIVIVTTTIIKATSICIIGKFWSLKHVKGKDKSNCHLGILKDFSLAITFPGWDVLHLPATMHATVGGLSRNINLQNPIIFVKYYWCFFSLLSQGLQTQARSHNKDRGGKNRSFCCSGELNNISSVRVIWEIAFRSNIRAHEGGSQVPQCKPSYVLRIMMAILNNSWRCVLYRVNSEYFLLLTDTFCTTEGSCQCTGSEHFLKTTSPWAALAHMKLCWYAGCIYCLVNSLFKEGVRQ